MFIFIIILNLYLYSSNIILTKNSNTILTKANISIVEINRGIVESVKVEVERFVNAVFLKNIINIVYMLDENACYLANTDGSSIIKTIKGNRVSYGYMATNKTLRNIKHLWHEIKVDNTVIVCTEIETKEDITPIKWYIYLNKIQGQWKISKLENNMQ